MLQGENEERDAHRDRIKELRGMDQETLTKETCPFLAETSKRPQPKELESYRKDELRQAFKDAQDS